MMMASAERDYYESLKFHCKCPNVQIHDLDEYNVKCDQFMSYRTQYSSQGFLLDLIYNLVG